MSHRLQVLIPEDLDIRLRMAAKRERVSKGEWVRRAILRTLERPDQGGGRRHALSRLASLGGPTGDIDQMLEEIDTGRTGRR